MAFRFGSLKEFKFDESLGRQSEGLLLSGEETKLISEMVADGHFGYLIAYNPVEHHIEPSRQTLEYVNRYYFGQGWLQASDALKSRNGLCMQTVCRPSSFRDWSGLGGL